MRGRSDASPLLEEAMTIAVFDPRLCEVIDVFAPAEANP